MDFITRFLYWLVSFDRKALILGASAIAAGLAMIAGMSSSPPSRMPAVSMSRRSTPPTVTFSSTVSRVVPAMSVTIARS